jgi:pyruvate/2-oxoacid:ferredoxin oxidoreductase alpha subunit
LNADSEKVALVIFETVWPLKAEHLGFLDQAQFVAVVENNFNGQFAHLITAATGRVIKNKINKYNGLPFEAMEIVKAYKKFKGKNG